MLLVLMLVVAFVATLPVDPIGTIALAVLTTALVVWPFGVLVWLARRWARIGDLRFVALVGVLLVTAVGSAGLAIALAG
ncbi:MAG: hypothetical protein EA388_12360 [Nitriliruptor sp.]|nr:MAG: hypothetical protein EA388_12360 [Nitriliruptor sp.]